MKQKHLDYSELVSKLNEFEKRIKVLEKIAFRENDSEDDDSPDIEIFPAPDRTARPMDSQSSSFFTHEKLRSPKNYANTPPGTNKGGQSRVIRC